jgi:hypothetical protein
MTSKPIFIAFTGPEIDQKEAAIEFSTGYECWNLKKFTIDAFISALQVKIPPLNDTVLKNNYRASDTDPNPDFGIRQSDYERCSWGLLLPNLVPNALGSFGETLFLLNLYSPHFLYPEFYASDFGLCRPRQSKNPLLFFAQQNQADRFKRVEFAKFYDALISESVYAVWQADRVAHWSKEEWRVFVACLLFTELKEYENRKEVFTWQREAADMATILEALFAAESADNTEIGYRLRKRIAVLLARHIPGIEREVKELYRQRSAFVHGSFFGQIHKETKGVDRFAQLPSPPFQFLYSQKEYVRVALVAYLYLHKVFEADRKAFAGCDSVLHILEEAIIDTGLRSTVEKSTSYILGLL